MIFEKQISFPFKPTDTTNDENTNPNDGFCSECFVYQRKYNNFLCFETDLRVSKWGIITAQCLTSRLYSGTVLCVGGT